MFFRVGFNTQPPEGGCCFLFKSPIVTALFQHTATRRWLQIRSSALDHDVRCFNTQPPEGGCLWLLLVGDWGLWFQHTATRRWLLARWRHWMTCRKFQHTATRRWLLIGISCDRKCLMFQHTATRRWLQQILILTNRYLYGFNTQPPEGGCSLHKKAIKISELNTVFR